MNDATRRKEREMVQKEIEEVEGNHTDADAQCQPSRQDHGLRAGGPGLHAERTGHVEERTQGESHSPAERTKVR